MRRVKSTYDNNTVVDVTVAKDNLQTTNTNSNTNIQNVTVVNNSKEDIPIVYSNNPYEGVNEGEVEEVRDDDKELIKEIIRIYRDIITEDPKLVLNLIDQTGRVIVPTQDLIRLIAIIAKTDRDNVKIQYIDNDAEPGCAACAKKLNPIKDISSIKIKQSNGVYADFSVICNEAFNLLNDEYKISLDRTILSIQ